MAIRIGINGFGRIGRLAYRYATEVEGVEIVAINDLVPADQLAYLLSHDTMHGMFPRRGEGKVVADGNTLKVVCNEGGVVSQSVVTAIKDPTEIPWDDFKVDVVLECTGLFLDRAKAELHFKGPKNQGVKRVILSAPAKDKDIRTIVYKVNEASITPEDRVLSNSSCTTNCLAPVVSVLLDKFGIENIFFNTIHAFTNDQNIIDSPHKKDWRRARTGSANIIPTSTGADKAIAKIYPELVGRIKGVATRVPVPDGSATDVVVTLKRDTTVDEVNAALVEAANGRMKGILEAADDSLVSSDIVGNRHSSVADLQQTNMLGGRTLRLLAWYDNEMGYSCRMIDLVKYLLG